MEKWIGIPYLKKEIENLKKGWTSLDYDSALVDVLCIIKKYEQNANMKIINKYKDE